MSFLDWVVPHISHRYSAPDRCVTIWIELDNNYVTRDIDHRTRDFLVAHSDSLYEFLTQSIIGCV